MFDVGNIAVRTAVDQQLGCLKMPFSKKKDIEWRWGNSKKYIMDHLVDLILDLFLLPDQAHLQVF